MQDVLLSIVIPCYNAFSVMGQALSWLERNKGTLIEAVIVDDCSTDDSYDKLLSYVKTSGVNIQLYQNERNSGAGETRNYGIQKATGKYITFLDADDCFSEKYYGTVLPYLKKDYDCIIYDHVVVDGEQTTKGSAFFCDMASCDLDKKEALVFVRGATWGKIYKREQIIEKGVRFLDIPRNEDMPFTKCAVAASGTIAYIKQPLYQYIQREDSLMHNIDLLTPQNAQKAFFHVKERLERDYPEEVEGMFILEYLYSTCQTNLRFMKQKEWKQWVRQCKQLYPQFMRNKYYGRYGLSRRIIFRLIDIRSYSILKLLLYLFHR